MGLVWVEGREGWWLGLGLGGWWQNHGAACPALCFDLQPGVLVPTPPYFAQPSVLVVDQQDHFGSTFIFISTTTLCSVLTVVNQLCFFLILPIYFLVCRTLPDCVMFLHCSCEACSIFLCCTELNALHPVEGVGSTKVGPRPLAVHCHTKSYVNQALRRNRQRHQHYHL